MSDKAFAKAAFAAALICALPTGAAAGFPGLPIPTNPEEALKSAAGDLLGRAKGRLPKPVADALPTSLPQSAEPRSATPGTANPPPRAESAPTPPPADAPVATPVPAGFTPIGTFGEFRIDGVRRGTHNDLPVRFLDVTLKNTSDITTFADTIQVVRWQGRTSGQSVRALRPDGTPFGMHGQYVTPGQVVAVTYPIPDREDVDGVTVEYPHPGDGPKKRVWTWDDLAVAGQPGAAR